MYVCICHGIRESDLLDAAASRLLDASTLIELFNLDAPDCCGRCAGSAEQMAALANAQIAEPEGRALASAATRGVLRAGS